MEQQVTDEIDESIVRLKIILNLIDEQTVKYNNSRPLDDYGKIKPERGEIFKAQRIGINQMWLEVDVLHKIQEKARGIYERRMDLYKLLNIVNKEALDHRGREIELCAAIVQSVEDEQASLRRENRKTNYVEDHEARIMRNLRNGRGDLEGL